MRSFVWTISILALLAGGTIAAADETDQFMSWNVQLRDSAEAVNDHLNEQIRMSIDLSNRSIESPCDCQTLAFDTIDYIFNGRLTARFMDYVVSDDDIDVYPPRSMSNARYQKLSIYRGITFPYILPMARTMRIGDVYFGEDKWGHFFGIGKRYYKRYLWNRKNGFSEQEAVDMAISWGVLSENTVVGMVVDGIFSHADLEANYQGFELARHMCEGDAPYLREGKDRWELAREIDLRDYVTPYWDESYNVSHYWGRRRMLVLPILTKEYAEEAHSAEVLARFRAYEKYSPSRSVEFVRHHFLDRDRSPQRDQTFAALGLRAGYPSALLAAMPVP